MANEKFTFRLLEPEADGKYTGLVTLKPDGRVHGRETFNACSQADAEHLGRCAVAYLNKEEQPTRTRPPAEVRSKRV